MATAGAPIRDPDCVAGVPDVPAHQLRLHGRLRDRGNDHCDSDDDHDDDEPRGTGAEAPTGAAAGAADGARAADDSRAPAPADHDDRHSHAIAVADDLLTIDEALALVLENVSALEAEDVPL